MNQTVSYVDLLEENTPQVKIVVLGGGGVGKSSLIVRLVADNYLDDYDPTIEDRYAKATTVDDKPVVLQILDTAGQEEFQSMRDQWIKEAEVFGLTYSITSLNSFKQIKVIAHKIMSVLEWSDADLNDSKTIKPIVIIGNKCDLEHYREVTHEQGKSLANKWGVPFFETSAKTKINDSEVFHELVRVHRKYQHIDTPSSSSTNTQTGSTSSKYMKWVSILMCCVCIGIFTCIYHIYHLMIHQIECCRSREEKRIDQLEKEKRENEEKRKREYESLKFFKVKKLPPDRIPMPVLSLKNFKIQRTFYWKRFVKAMLCGLFLPIVISVQTVVFFIHHISGECAMYSELHKFDNIHHSILLDFCGIVVGRTPYLDPETLKNKEWFMRQTRKQIMQRFCLTALVYLAFFICIYNVLYMNEKSLSLVETIGPFTLFWVSWILLSIWIGYEPKLYPTMPLLTRLRGINLFLGDKFTHRTDAYKFLRAYAKSRDKHKDLVSYGQLIFVLLFGLFYALMPVITRITVEHKHAFWAEEHIFVRFGAFLVNLLFVGTFIYSLEVQFGRHFDIYIEWMRDLTALLSKDSMDEESNKTSHLGHLLPQKGDEFSRNLFLSLTRRSNALGWVEIRSFLANEGKLLFAEQELATLWLLLVTAFLTVFLVYRVYFVDGKPINSALFNASSVLNLICFLSLIRIAVTGYRFADLQQQQEQLLIEQKYYMRCNLSDDKQFEINIDRERRKHTRNLSMAFMKSVHSNSNNVNKINESLTALIKLGKPQQHYSMVNKEQSSTFTTATRNDDTVHVYEGNEENVALPVIPDDGIDLDDSDCQSSDDDSDIKYEPNKHQQMKPIVNNVDNEETKFTMDDDDDDDENANLLTIDEHAITIEDVMDKLDDIGDINWNTYNFGFLDDTQQIVKQKDIYPRLFKIKLNSVLPKAVAGVLFAALSMLVRIFFLK